MKKINISKKMTAIALSLIMILGLVPITASASSTSVRGAEGHVLDNIYTGTFTEGLNSTIFIYATPGACELPYTVYDLNGGGGNFGVPKYDSDEWYFAGWKTWYKGSELGAGVVDSDKENPKFNDTYNYFNPNADNGALLNSYPQGYMTVLKEYFWDGTYYLSAIYEPLVTVSIGEGIPYTVSGASKRAENKYSTKYNSGMTINVDKSAVVTDVSANYGTDYSKNESYVTINSIIRPTNININARLKQLKVQFNANGGNGMMDAQVFEYGVAHTLTSNGFTATGYDFVGWNTKADGSGIAYSDNQSVTFTPENDGDTVNLYAQWEPKQYTVTYKADGVTLTTETVEHGKDATLTAVPEKEGYIGKWDNDGKNITADTTINAVYTGNSYTVSFDTNGGTVLSPIAVTFDEKYGKLPSSAITGLSGGDSNWYLMDENGNVTDTKVKNLTKVSTARDHELFVKRSVLAPNVSIALTVPGGISDGYQYYIPGDSQRVLTATVGNMNADILDYTYQWYKDGAPIEGANSNVLTLDGNVSDSGTYKVEVTATLKDGVNIVVTTNSATGSKEQNIKILHATNTLSYDANGGEGGPQSSYSGGTTLKVSKDAPVREHYDFVGWNTMPDGTGNNYEAEDVYTFADDGGNGGCFVTLYAQWKPKEYTVTYTDGVEDAEIFADVTNKVAYGSATPAFDEVNLIRDGYIFIGWSPMVSEFVKADATYTAQWVKVCFITYNDGVEGEEIFEDVIYEVVLGAPTPPCFNEENPTREGYTFIGWSPVLADTATENVTYTAQWMKNNEVKIPENPDGGKDEIDNETPTTGEDITVTIKPDPNKNDQKIPDTDSLANGDNSSLWMLFTVIFISGGAVFGFAFTGRKRKIDEK